jgi:hypothetical protein
MGADGAPESVALGVCIGALAHPHHETTTVRQAAVHIVVGACVGAAAYWITMVPAEPWSRALSVAACTLVGMGTQAWEWAKEATR